MSEESDDAYYTVPSVFKIEEKKRVRFDSLKRIGFFRSEGGEEASLLKKIARSLKRLQTSTALRGAHGIPDFRVEIVSWEFRGGSCAGRSREILRAEKMASAVSGAVKRDKILDWRFDISDGSDGREVSGMKVEGACMYPFKQKRGKNGCLRFLIFAIWTKKGHLVAGMLPVP